MNKAIYSRMSFGLLILMLVTLSACAQAATSELQATQAPAVEEPAAKAELSEPMAVYPSLSGIELAYPNQALTANNVKDIKLLGVWGQPSPEAVAWAPDARWVATGSSIGVNLYDPTNLSPLNYQAAPGPVSGLASARLAGGNAILATIGWDGRVTLWHAFPSGELANQQQWRAHDSTIMAAALSTDARFLATGDVNGQIRLWSPVSDPTQVLAALAGHDSWINALAFSPDGSQLASAGGDGKVKQWKMGGATDVLRVIDIGPGEVDSLVYSPDGTILATGGEDGVINLWATGTGDLLSALAGPGPGVRSLAFTPTSTADNGILAAGYNDGSLWVWSLPGYAVLSRFPGSGQALNGLAFSPDGKYLSAAGETLSLWLVNDLPIGAPAGQIQPRAGGSLTGLAFTPDGALLATSGGDGTVRIWQTADGSLLNILSGQADPIASLAISPVVDPTGMLLASGTNGGAIRLWRLPGGSPIEFPFAQAQRVTSLAFSPAGNLLASIDGSGVVQVNEISPVLAGSGSIGIEAQLFQNIDSGGSPGVGVAFLPDGSMISAGQDGRLRIWRAGEVNAASSPGILGTEGKLAAFAVSPDGEWLATAHYNGSAALWAVSELAENSQARFLDGTYLQIASLAFSPDGSLLAGGLANGIQLWDLAQGKAIALLQGYTHPVTGVVFSSDGRYLASTSQDGVIRIWGVMP